VWLRDCGQFVSPRSTPAQRHRANTDSVSRLQNRFLDRPIIDPGLFVPGFQQGFAVADDQQRMVGTDTLGRDLNRQSSAEPIKYFPLVKHGMVMLTWRGGSRMKTAVAASPVGTVACSVVIAIYG